MNTTAETRAPLSSGQGRLWFAEQLASGASGYVVQRAVRFIGPVNAELLRGAVAVIVARHGILRTTYDDSGPVPEQVEHVSVPDVFAVHDLAGADTETVNAWIAAQRRVPFDLRASPPLRFHLLRIAPDDAVLLLTLHHIAVDGWSVSVVFDELPRVYEALAAGKPPELPPAPSYLDYTRSQHESADPAPAKLKHWRRELAGVDPLSGPEPDFPVASRTTDRAHAVGFRLPAPAWARIDQLSRRFRCTPFMTVLACYAGALHEVGASADLVVATPASGRLDAKYHRLVGFLVNVVPLRVRCDESSTLAGLLAEVRETCLTASEYNDVPFERIVAVSGVRRFPRRPALAQVLYDLHPRPPLPELPGVTTIEWQVPPVATRLEVELHVSYAQDGAVGHLLASADLFDAETAEWFCDIVQQVVTRWTAEPETPLGRILLATEEEPA